ncbi:ethanolamine kinase 1 isoform X2 [Gadus morhua]|nr:ethanolamine kinase 1-like isoform X2 [Gadus morhua]XP_030223052.1 ethanolamine kinase 1-like isoform X2 [Gadus morhua]
MDRGSAAAGGVLIHLDIHVDEEKPRLGILELLKTLRPQWKTEDIQMKVFTEGITNCLTGCYVGSLQEACVLVRVYGRNTELYVDRQREVEMFQLLHAHHCGPLIYCSFHNGICYEFVRGEVLDDRLLRQPSIFRLIAAEMGRIHSIKPPAPGPAEAVLWARMAKLLTLVGNNVQDGPDTHSPQNVPGLPSHKVLSDEMETLKKHLSDTLSPVVLSHNDLLTKNIVYNLPEGTVKFIDYEYADYNYQAFDIGNHFNEFAGVSDMDFSRYPSRGLQREWLRAYLESYRRASGRPSPPTETEVTALYIQVCKFSLIRHRPTTLLLPEEGCLLQVDRGLESNVNNFNCQRVYSIMLNLFIHQPNHGHSRYTINK